ncbi:MAG: MerR family transcriptional regulator [Caulobacteraceae bacterium]|nr:MerR family transcriptional regulator [Caulobacteraceae bacterium]
MAKGPEAFRSISEAADELGVPQHVLRFWETKFSFIRPMKRAGGRRFYRPQDIAVLRQVRRLLHEEGYTIKGVQKLHRELGMKRLLEASRGEGLSGAGRALPDGLENAALSPERRARLLEALEALEAAKRRLEDLLG